MSEVPAGDFGAWLAAMRAVLRGEQDADVPCGDCVGCCVSSYPIPLRPTDQVALERIPARYLQLPSAVGGLARMGFREDGTCPMLAPQGCSIYADRPRTCRDYDCRIYAAAGLLPDGDRPVIRGRVLAWRFRFATAEDEADARCLQRAALFIRLHAARFPLAMRASSATAAAVLAIKTWQVFQQEPDGQSAETIVQRVSEAARDFDAGARGSGNG